MRGFLFANNFFIISFDKLYKMNLNVIMKKGKKERIRRGTLKILNIKLLPNNGTDDYIKLFENLQRSDYRVKTRTDRFILFLGFKGYLNNQIYIGDFLEYTSLDPNGFIDLDTKESINNPYNEKNLGANHKKTKVYFIPKAHRLGVFKNSDINISTIKKYLEVAYTRYSKDKGIKNQEIFIYLEKSHDLVEVLEEAYSVTYLSAKITYTNRDSTNGFKKTFDNKLRASGSDIANMELKAEKGKSLNMNEDSLPKTIVELAKSNGELEAKIIKEEGDKVSKINTEDYPLEISLQYTESNMFNKILEAIISQFRPNK